MPASTRAALPRAGLLVLWGNAYLQGADSLDDAAHHAVGADALHRVAGVPGEAEPVTIGVALGRLRGLGVTALRLVLPEPGDPTGFPGPADATADAVAAGEAVVTVGPPDVPHLAMIPAVAESEGGAVVRWDVVRVDVSAHPHGLPTLSEAERALAEGMIAATTALSTLDLARGRDEVAGDLRAVERTVSRIDLPHSLPARGQRAVVQSARLLGILEVASRSDGAAVTAYESVARLETLRPLRAAARYALCAACSAEAEPEPVRKAWQSGR